MDQLEFADVGKQSFIHPWCRLARRHRLNWRQTRTCSDGLDCVYHFARCKVMEHMTDPRQEYQAAVADNVVQLCRLPMGICYLICNACDDGQGHGEFLVAAGESSGGRYHERRLFRRCSDLPWPQ